MPMTPKQVAAKWFEEVWNQGKPSAIEEMLHTTAKVQGLGEPITGHAQFKELQALYRGAFPDLRIDVDDIFAEGEQVVVRWTASGTHKGNHLGIPPTGKKARFTGIAIARVKDGKIVEGWNAFDQLGMLQQIGAA